MIKRILILMGCMLSIAAADPDWMEISDDAEVTVYVNVIELKHQKFKNVQSVGAWMKSTFKGHKSHSEIGDGKPIAEFRAMHWYQCRDKKISDAVEMAFYGKNGGLIDSYSEDGDAVMFKHAIPDTIESSLYTTVCLVDLSNEFAKLKERGVVSDYDYRKLEENYPNQVRLLKELKDID